MGFRHHTVRGDGSFLISWLVHQRQKHLSPRLVCSSATSLLPSFRGSECDAAHICALFELRRFMLLPIVLCEFLAAAAAIFLETAFLFLQYLYHGQRKVSYSASLLHGRKRPS